LFELVHLWLASYGRVALILAIASCLGYPVCRKTVRGPLAIALMPLAGLALFSVAVCLLAWFRIFTGLAVVVLGAAAAVLALACLVRDLRHRRPDRDRRRRPSATAVICFGVLGLVVLGFSVLALYPVTAFDATSYHLPLARDLVHEHGLAYDPFVRYSFFPQANEALFAVMQLLTPEGMAASALEYSVLALIVVALPLWFLGSGRNVGAGFLAGILILASPVVVFAGTSPLVDVWTLCFVMAGTLTGLEAAEGRAPPLPAMMLAGLMFGEAIATKYTGAIFVLAAVLGVLVAAGRAPALWRALPGTLAGAVVIVLPWYAWTVHITGDPLYPFATGLFGNRPGLWTRAEIQLQVARDTTGSYHPGLLHTLRYLRGELPYETGTGRSPLSWLLGLGVIRLLTPSGWRDRTYLGVGLAALIDFLLTMFVSSSPRYLIPGIGFLALAVGLTADVLIPATQQRCGRWLRGPWPVVAGCLLAVLVGLWTSSGYARDYHQSGPPSSNSDTFVYLAIRIPCYRAAQYLNHVAGADYRAWGENCEQAHYYAKGRLISDEFSLGSRSRIFDDTGRVMPRPQVLWQRLAPLHVRWLILSSQTVPRVTVLQASGLFRYVTTQGPERLFAVLPRRQA
jgi:hypothetical protein